MTTPNEFTGPDWQTVTRPGINAESIAANGIRRVNATDTEHLCGAPMGGIWIPYRTINGSPITEENREFGRLRLAVEEGGRKYHARAGTRSHLYQPAGLADLLAQPSCSTLFLTEGEFKALSACEHGIPAAGVSGIGNAAPSGRLVDELQLLLTDSMIERVVFVGDADVGINPDFSRAMVKLTGALPEGVSLGVIVPGLHAPAKGLDDQVEKLGDGFGAYWSALLGATLSVPRGMRWEELALALLRREKPEQIASIVNGAAEQEAA